VARLPRHPAPTNTTKVRGSLPKAHPVIFSPAGAGQTGCAPPPSSHQGRAPLPSSSPGPREDLPTGPVRTKFGLQGTPLANFFSNLGRIAEPRSLRQSEADSARIHAAKIPAARTLFEDESGRRRTSPFSAAHQLRTTPGALPTNFDFDRQERAQAQRTLDNMKALPALGVTLKHDTVSSFVKGLAAYCEQNNIGPLVIENDVELQVKVWTGVAS